MRRPFGAEVVHAARRTFRRALEPSTELRQGETMKDRIRGGQTVLCLTPLALCLSAALSVSPCAAIAAHATRPASLLAVGSCADDGASDTLRSVVATAVSGDTVDLTGLTCGHITLLTGEIDVPVDDLTINGPGRDALTIDGNGAGRVIAHFGAGTLTLSALTIANGSVNSDTEPNPFRNTYGGCILSDHGDEYGASPYGSVTIIDSAVTHCSVTAGSSSVPGRARDGGIAAAGTITVERSTIDDCHIYNNSFFAGFFPAGGGGGALFANYLITVSDSVITDNTATISVSGQMRGGGISAYGPLVMSNSVVARNFAGCDTSSLPCKFALGGGIDVLGTASISSSTISYNIAESAVGLQGGGINARDDLYLIDTQVTGNVTRGTPYVRRGGGIALNGYATSHLSRTTISGNSSAIGGGIYAGGNQELRISDSTISGNSASDAGGGLFLNGVYLSVPYSAYPLELNNSTVTANSSTGSRGGGGIVDLHVPLFGISDFESSIVAGNSNAVASATYDADLATSTPGITGARNLIVAASGVELPPDTLSADPLLGPLQDNGGPTPTHALLEGSPAIDGGNNVDGLAFDQRGDGFPRVSGAAADIGAFELQQAASAPTLAKRFMPDAIAAGASSLLTITLTNANTGAVTLIADLVDEFPASIMIASPSDAATSCPGGVVAAASGTSTVTLESGAQIPPMGSCTVTVSVIGATEGTYTNTIPAGALQTDSGSNADAATADLTVNSVPPVPPTLAKNFESDTIEAGASSTLTITLGNENAVGATLIAPLSDELPPPLVIANPANAITTCPDGVLTANSGSGTVALGAGAAIPPAGTCSVVVSVTTGTEGAYTNTIPSGALQTDLGNNADPASAALTVTQGNPPDRFFADGFDGAAP
jgi:hypothetical protein